MQDMYDSRDILGFKLNKQQMQVVEPTFYLYLIAEIM